MSPSRTESLAGEWIDKPADIHQETATLAAPPIEIVAGLISDQDRFATELKQGVDCALESISKRVTRVDG